MPSKREQAVGLAREKLIFCCGYQHSKSIKQSGELRNTMERRYFALETVTA